MAKNHCIYPDPVQVIEITLPSGADLEARVPYLFNGLHGIVMQEGVAGDVVSFDISARTWQVNVGGLSVSAGTKLYLDATTKALTTTSTSNHFFGIALTAKDSANVADVYIVPQHA